MLYSLRNDVVTGGKCWPGWGAPRDADQALFSFRYSHSRRSIFILTCTASFDAFLSREKNTGWHNITQLLEYGTATHLAHVPHAFTDVPQSNTAMAPHEGHLTQLEPVSAFPWYQKEISAPGIMCGREGARYHVWS